MISAAQWRLIMTTRSAVGRELELLRKEGAIGSSLDAEVTLYCGGELHSALSQLDDELRFVLITSQARLLSEAPDAARDTELEGLKVMVTASQQQKCERCWHHVEDVGSDETHPDLCGRCITNIDGAGEQRKYA